ncbi:MAG TPA: aldehyde dehydrogenase [Pseudolysinimonas sp.]|nr:aldehyde dehydrogenase [Pseudolysinimonas sp.]
MNMMTDMMKSMPLNDMAMDMDMVQKCMEACSAVEMAATMCADACAGEGMGKCSSMCMNMADVAMTTMRMMMRPMGMDKMAMSSMMTACMEMGKACAAECRMHDSDHCRICAMACDAMVEACTSMMAAMSAV